MTIRRYTQTSFTQGEVGSFIKGRAELGIYRAGLETCENFFKHSDVNKIFRSIGSDASTVKDIMKGPDAKVMKAIQAGIDAANKEAASNAQKIQKWMIIPRDFSIPGGEIGPTLKVKRQQVVKMYQKQINKIYT